MERTAERVHICRSLAAPSLQPRSLFPKRPIFSPITTPRLETCGEPEGASLAVFEAVKESGLIGDYSYSQVPAHNQIDDHEWYVAPYAASQIRCGLSPNSLPLFLYCDLREQHDQLRQPFSNLRRVRRIFIAILVALILSYFYSLSLGISEDAMLFNHVLFNPTESPYLHSHLTSSQPAWWAIFLDTSASLGRATATGSQMVIQSVSVNGAYKNGCK